MNRILLTANPTRVAIELLQLHDLKNREAAGSNGWTWFAIE